MSTTGTTAINPSLYANPGYDPRKNFSPIGQIASTPVALMAHPSFPANSVAEVIALAKSRPGKLAIGTPPPGTTNHLAAELFKASAGLDITIVPYKGTGPLTNDLVGGHVALGFNTIAPAFGNIQASLLRVLAVTSPARTSLLPDVPTVSEAGLPDFEAVLQYGLMAPAGTPEDIVERLNKELRALLDLPEVRQRIVSEGGEPLPSSRQAQAADMEREEAKWSALIKRLNLKAQ